MKTENKGIELPEELISYSKRVTGRIGERGEQTPSLFKKKVKAAIFLIAETELWHFHRRDQWGQSKLTTPR